ncbi:MAG: nucleotidyltransferase, partial [Opitutales bacterium]
ALPEGDGLFVSMVGYVLKNTLSPHGTVNRGICQLQGDVLRSVQEFTEISEQEEGVIRGKNELGICAKLPKDAIVSMNFWGFSPALFALIEDGFESFLAERGREMNSEYYLPSLVDQLIKDGKAECPVLKTNSPWFGVTYPEDKRRVIESIARLTAEGVYI